MTARSTTPKGLGAPGKQLWASIAGPYVLDPAELVLLTAACRQADDVAALEAAVAADGVIVTGAAGQRRLNGAVPELRQSRLALARLLGELALPSEAVDRPRTAAQQRASRAALARWDGRRTTLSDAS